MQRLRVFQVMEFDWSIFLLLLSFSFRREEINEPDKVLATSLSNGFWKPHPITPTTQPHLEPQPPPPGPLPPQPLTSTTRCPSSPPTNPVNLTKCTKVVNHQ